MNRAERAGENLPKYLQDHRWDFKVPVQRDDLGEAGAVPARVARLAWEAYAAAGHGLQSFEELHRRGGFSWQELVALLRGPAHYRHEHFEACWRYCGKDLVGKAP